jgi:hypothetical protein
MDEINNDHVYLRALSSQDTLDEPAEQASDNTNTKSIRDVKQQSISMLPTHTLNVGKETVNDKSYILTRYISMFESVADTRYSAMLGLLSVEGPSQGVMRQQSAALMCAKPSFFAMTSFDFTVAKGFALTLLTQNETVDHELAKRLTKVCRSSGHIHNYFLTACQIPRTQENLQPAVVAIIALCQYGMSSPMLNGLTSLVACMSTEVRTQLATAVGATTNYGTSRLNGPGLARLFGSILHYYTTTSEGPITRDSEAMMAYISSVVVFEKRMEQITEVVVKADTQIVAQLLLWGLDAEHLKELYKDDLPRSSFRCHMKMNINNMVGRRLSQILTFRNATPLSPIAVLSIVENFVEDEDVINNWTIPPPDLVTSRHLTITQSGHDNIFDIHTLDLSHELTDYNRVYDKWPKAVMGDGGVYIAETALVGILCLLIISLSVLTLVSVSTYPTWFEAHDIDKMGFISFSLLLIGLSANFFCMIYVRDWAWYDIIRMRRATTDLRLVASKWGVSESAIMLYLHCRNLARNLLADVDTCVLPYFCTGRLTVTTPPTVATLPLFNYHPTRVMQGQQSSVCASHINDAGSVEVVLFTQDGPRLHAQVFNPGVNAMRAFITGSRPIDPGDLTMTVGHTSHHAGAKRTQVGGDWSGMQLSTMRSSSPPPLMGNMLVRPGSQAWRTLSVTLSDAARRKLIKFFLMGSWLSSTLHDESLSISQQFSESLNELLVLQRTSSALFKKAHKRYLANPERYTRQVACSETLSGAFFRDGRASIQGIANVPKSIRGFDQVSQNTPLPLVGAYVSMAQWYELYKSLADFTQDECHYSLKETISFEFSLISPGVKAADCAIMCLSNLYDSSMVALARVSTLSNLLYDSIAVTSFEWGIPIASTMSQREFTAAYGKCRRLHVMMLLHFDKSSMQVFFDLVKLSSTVDAYYVRGLHHSKTGNTESGGVSAEMFGRVANFAYDIIVLSADEDVDSATPELSDWPYITQVAELETYTLEEQEKADKAREANLAYSNLLTMISLGIKVDISACKDANVISAYNAAFGLSVEEEMQLNTTRVSRECAMEMYDAQMAATRRFRGIADTEPNLDDFEFLDCPTTTVSSFEELPYHDPPSAIELPTATVEDGFEPDELSWPPGIDIPPDGLHDSCAARETYQDPESSPDVSACAIGSSLTTTLSIMDRVTDMEVKDNPGCIALQTDCEQLDSPHRQTSGIQSVCCPASSSYTPDSNRVRAQMLYELVCLLFEPQYYTIVRIQSLKRWFVWCDTSACTPDFSVCCLHLARSRVTRLHICHDIKRASVRFKDLGTWICQARLPI